MKPNIGKIDKALRIFAAICMTALYILGIVTGITGYILLASSVALLATVALNWCPACQILGLNTCEIKRQ